MAIFVAKSGQLQTVKGVFECKNILREGVDYEKYDWLFGDRVACIDTNLFITDYRDVTLYIKYKDFSEFSSQTYMLSAGYVASNQFNLTTAWNNTGKIRISNVANSVNVLTSISGEHEIKIVNDKVYGDNVSYNGYKNRWAYKGVGNLHLFSSYDKGNKSTGYVAYLRVTSNVGSISLTPCQLLRNIPAKLDNNGIARSAGECGMYDAVSGKFFGNMASKGSFTVTND